MKSIPDKSVHLILTDLPYGQTSHEWDTPLNFEHLWNEWKRILVDGGVVALCAKGDFMIDTILSNRDWYRYEWVWDKNKAANFAHVRYRPLYAHEYILIFYNRVGTYNPQMGKRDKIYRQLRSENSTVGIADSMRRQHLTETWKYYPKSILSISDIAQKNKKHPTEKPVKLFEYLILTYTNENDVVLDCCAGVGTTAVACLLTNRCYICYENNNNFAQIAKQQIKKTKKAKTSVIDQWM